MEVVAACSPVCIVTQFSSEEITAANKGVATYEGKEAGVACEALSECHCGAAYGQSCPFADSAVHLVIVLDKDSFSRSSQTLIEGLVQVGSIDVYKICFRFVIVEADRFRIGIVALAAIYNIVE